MVPPALPGPYCWRSTSTTDIAPLTPTLEIEFDPTRTQTLGLTLVAVTRLRFEAEGSFDIPDIRPGVPITPAPPEEVLIVVDVVVVTWPPPFPPPFPPPEGTEPFPVAVKRFWYAMVALVPTATRSETGFTAVMNGSCVTTPEVPGLV